MRANLILIIFRCLIPLVEYILKILKAKENPTNRDKARIYILEKFIKIMEIDKCSRTVSLKKES